MIAPARVAAYDVLRAVGRGQSDLPSALARVRTKLAARTAARDAPPRGSRVVLRPKPEEAHVFDPVSGERLG